jgi:hypothetical protein
MKKKSNFYNFLDNRKRAAETFQNLKKIWKNLDQSKKNVLMKIKYYFIKIK